MSNNRVIRRCQLIRLIDVPSVVLLGRLMDLELSKVQVDDNLIKVTIPYKTTFTVISHHEYIRDDLNPFNEDKLIIVNVKDEWRGDIFDAMIIRSDEDGRRTISLYDDETIEDGNTTDGIVCVLTKMNDNRYHGDFIVETSKNIDIFKFNDEIIHVYTIDQGYMITVISGDSSLTYVTDGSYTDSESVVDIPQLQDGEGLITQQENVTDNMKIALYIIRDEIYKKYGNNGFDVSVKLMVI